METTKKEPRTTRDQSTSAMGTMEGWLDLKKLRAWQATLLEQALTFKGLSSITWGGSDGRSVGRTGKDRVRNLIRNSANLSADEITKRINREPARFLGGKNPDDDLTFVIAKVL